MANKEEIPLSEVLDDDKKIIAANENLKKRSSYYLNNHIIFRTPEKPRSCYINLRLSKKPDQLISGKSNNLNNV